MFAIANHSASAALTDGRGTNVQGFRAQLRLTF